MPAFLVSIRFLPHTYTSDIGFGFNEDTLTITDHSDESDIRMISRSTYPKYAYSHQGWMASDWHDIILLDDELGMSSLPSTFFIHVAGKANQ